MRPELLLATIFALSMAMIAGCNREGPMEKAGKKMDKAIEETEQAAKDVQKDLEEQLTRDQENNRS